MFTLLLLFLLVPVGISSADTVYTWYYGKQLASFLEAMNSYVSSAGFVDLWKVVVGFSFIFLLFAIIVSAGDYRQALRLLKFYVIVIATWYLLVLIKVPVDVVDRCTKTTHTNIEAPWAVVKPLSWLTRIEGSVRESLVSFFGVFLPDAYKRNEGCFTGYELLRPALTYQPKDPYLRLSIENYIRDCIVPTVLTGDIDRFTLVNSNDLWNNEFACTTGKLCAALTTVYYSSTNPEGIVDGCPNAYARISADIVNEYTRAWRDIKVKVFGSASAIAETDIPVYLGEVTPFLMSVALTGENLIRQAITIQSLNQVSAEFATAIAYQEAYLNALARLNMLDFGRGGTLNAMKGVIETILVGLTPAFFLLFLTPIGGRVFYGWITAFVWLVLWSVAEVVTVSFLFLSVGDNQKFDFTLAQIDRINLAFNKAAQISSLMSDYIPLLTLFLATGSIYAMTHFATGMSRELRDEHGTKVMSSGNLDVGNVRARGYSDLATTLAASSVGTVNWGTANAGVWTGNELRVGNTTASQYHGYDPKIGANLSGVWETPGKFLGSINGGTYSGQGRWNIDGSRAVLMHGTARAATSTALEQITGGQIRGLRDAEIKTANGQLVYARGIDEMTGAEVTYRRSSDGIETMTYNYGSWTAQLMKDKNGEWRVVGGSGPVDMNVAQRYVENLENSKAQMDRVATAFRSSEGISNADSQTFNAGYRLAYDIAHGKGGASEYERGFARDLIRATEEAALTRLANEGKLSLEGKEIDEFEARKRARGGVELDTGLLSKILPKNLRSKLEGGIEKAIATKDGYVVQDTKGHYWFFGKNESINDALRDAWKTTVSGENKDFFNYRENTTDGKYTSEDFRKDLTSFRNRASEYAATRAEELGRRISFARQNARDINAKATQFLINDFLQKAQGDDVREKLGNAMTELNTLVSTPQGMMALTETADRVVDEMMKDRELERPDVNEVEVRSAANRAEVEGSRARDVEVQAPAKDAEQVYREVKSDIEGRMDRMGEEYQESREAVDAQKNVYENTKMNSPVETLPRVNRFDQLREEIQDLLKQKSDLAARISKEERDLRTDLRIFLAASTGGQLNFGEAMELIRNPDKLKEYREKGPYDKLDPNVFESFSKRYFAIQEMKRELSDMQKELDAKMKEYEDLKPYAQARDLQRGDYEVKYRDDKGPGKHPQIETTTEQATEGLDKKIEDYKEDRKTPEEKKKEILRKVDEKVKKEYPDALKDFLY